METPKIHEGKLTEHIMAGMPAMPVARYNNIYSAVLSGLKSVEEIGVVIVPDNAWALMAVITPWSIAKKRRLYKMIDAMLRPD